MLHATSARTSLDVSSADSPVADPPGADPAAVDPSGADPSGADPSIADPSTARRDRSSAGRASARERLLAAADELFYEEGVHIVGIDRVIERAGVAKASLYSAFGSKDELIRAYLDRRHAVRRSRLNRAAAPCETPRERLLARFVILREPV